MSRAPRVAVVVLLSLGACGTRGRTAEGCAGATRAIRAEEPAQTTPTTGIDEPQARPRCPVEPALLPPLPSFAPPATGTTDRLVLEIIENPEIGECVLPQALLAGAPTRGPMVGALTGEGEGRRFALHQVRDVAMIGEGPFFLAAGRSGLYLHDAITLARRARVVGEPALAVAVAPGGGAGTARAAVLVDPERRDHGETATLIVFDPATLEVTSRIEGAPRGRLRFSADGARLVVASPGGRLFVVDAASGEARTHEVSGAVADARFAPDHPDVLAYVGDRNEVLFRNVATGEPVAQSGGGALRTRRDLNALVHVPSAELTVAGGDDDLVHVYRGMLGERAEEIAAVSLEGNVEDLACGRDGRFVAATDAGQVQWFDGPRPTRSLGPLVPGVLGDAIRIALHGDDVVGAFFGQLFRWTADDALVRAPSAPGDLLLEDASADDVLVVLRMGAKVAVHRVDGESRPMAITEALGELAWADALRVVRGPDGARALLGLDHDGIQVAFVDDREGLSAMVGPGLALSVRFEITPGPPGRYALWDRRGVVYELDLPDKRWRLVGHADASGDDLEVRYDARRGYQAFTRGSRRVNIVTAAAPSPSPNPSPSSP